MMEKEFPAARKQDWFFIRLAAAFLFVLLAYTTAMFFLESAFFPLGILGFVQEAAWRVLIALCAAAAAGFCIYFILKHRPEAKAMLACAASAVLCALLSFFLARDVVLDLPYLNDPAVTYLSQMDFCSETAGDGPTRYYLEGINSEGEEHSFHLGLRNYNQCQQRRQEDPGLRAKITYLPHTNVVLSLDYID